MSAKINPEEPLPASVYAELVSCLSGVALPRAAGLYLARSQGVAIHSGYAGFTTGFDRAAVGECLARTLRGRDDVVIIDSDQELAWVAPMAEAVDTLAELNRQLAIG